MLRKDKRSGFPCVQPMSTGVTYQLIPKASADGIPILSMGYGRTSRERQSVPVDSTIRPITGPRPVVNHILELNNGNIKGKKIALVYHNSGYGKEPIRTRRAG